MRWFDEIFVHVNILFPFKVYVGIVYTEFQFTIDELMWNLKRFQFHHLQKSNTWCTYFNFIQVISFCSLIYIQTNIYPREFIGSIIFHNFS